MKERASGMANEHILESMGQHVFMVDPRGQGHGLAEYRFLDAYANKFFILTDSRGVFVSPKPVSPALVQYYGELGIDVARPANIIALEEQGEESSLLERSARSAEVMQQLAQRRGSVLVPYMVTPEVAAFARTNGLRLLADAEQVDVLSDKARFQEMLANYAAEIRSETGLDVGIPFGTSHAGERDKLLHVYKDLSGGGKRDVVVVRPKSASALGIFIHRASTGTVGFEAIVRGHFQPEDEVLVEAFVGHNHSPSMQGGAQTGSEYQHMYFGRQIITTQDAAGEGRVDYDGSQLPFGRHTVYVHPESLDRMMHVHRMMGRRFMTEQAVQGIGGFDSVANVTEQGILQSLQFTELNLHLPSSLSVYAASRKVYPDGFEGIADNVNIPLGDGQSVDTLMRQLAPHLIRRKGDYGMVPLNCSYANKVDMVFFARDAEHLAELRGKINL